jgi:hypothetical protein
MRVLGYDCALIGGQAMFTVAASDVRNITGEAVHKRTRFVACTGHPACGMFPDGLPQCIEDLDLVWTGCPLVDSHEILRFA